MFTFLIEKTAFFETYDFKDFSCFFKIVNFNLSASTKLDFDLADDMVCARFFRLPRLAKLLELGNDCLWQRQDRLDTMQFGFRIADFGLRIAVCGIN